MRCCLFRDGLLQDAVEGLSCLRKGQDIVLNRLRLPCLIFQRHIVCCHLLVEGKSRGSILGRRGQQGEAVRHFAFCQVSFQNALVNLLEFLGQGRLGLFFTAREQSQNGEKKDGVGGSTQTDQAEG